MCGVAKIVVAGHREMFSSRFLAPARGTVWTPLLLREGRQVLGGFRSRNGSPAHEYGS